MSRENARLPGHGMEDSSLSLAGKREADFMPEPEHKILTNSTNETGFIHAIDWTVVAHPRGGDRIEVKRLGLEVELPMNGTQWW